MSTRTAVAEKGGKTAVGEPVVGITKASLDRFVHLAASFRKRPSSYRSAISDADILRLKENVIMGRLIPAGTGMKHYRNVKVAPDATENQKQEDEFDEMENAQGGFILPAIGGIPGVESGSDEIEAKGDENEPMDLEDTEEFDIDEAMNINLDDDDINF